MFDLTLISRLQFAFTISFHIIFPAFSISMALFICIMEANWLRTKDIIYLKICKFWNKIFALTFGMGVVSGIVMEFQLGTNWGGFASSVGGVLGALFTYEVMTAFFVEAGFLGIMIFGWDKVGARLHFFATLCVSLGTTLSAFWILCANTWMQHPVGYQQIHDRFFTTSWVTILSNPLLMPRFIHMMLASYISGALVISSVCAFYLIKKQHQLFSKKCFSFVWMCLLILLPIQILIGDVTGIKVLEYQPLKTAAMEGIWESGPGQPLRLLAIPSQQQQKNSFELEIPKLASLINTHDLNGYMIGLKSVPPKDQPHMLPVFYSFRIMVGIGLLLLLMAIIALYLRIRGQLFDNPLFLKLCVISSPLGFIALWCGWITAEIGRQPWIVYNLIRTVDAGADISAYHVVTCFVLIIIVYAVVFGYFYFYYLNKILVNGPELDVTDALSEPFSYMHPDNGDKHQ